MIGRRTYEGFAAAWPGRDGEFAEKMNAMPKFVLTSTLTEPGWTNTTFLRGDVAEEVAALKDSDGYGPLLVVGSRELVHTLYECDLVDEHRLMVFPVVLGSGLRLFPDDAQNLTELTETGFRRFDNGVVVHTYRPEGPAVSED